MIVGITIALSFGLDNYIDKKVVAPNGHETSFVHGNFEDPELFIYLLEWNDYEFFEAVIFDSAVLPCCKNEALLLERLSYICYGPMHVPIYKNQLPKLDTMLAPMAGRSHTVLSINEFPLYKRTTEELAQEFFDCHHTNRIKAFLRHYNYRRTHQTGWSYLKISANQAL
jgi:hypothetical protein